MQFAQTIVCLEHSVSFYRGSTLRGKLKIIGATILSVWLSGAVITGVVAEIERRHDCIRDEGLIKGLYWCKTDSFERDGGYARQVINGLRWPFSLMGKTDDNNGQTVVSSSAKPSKEEFDKSAIGTMYKCYAVAVRADLPEEASTIAQAINKFRKTDANFESNHDLYILYSSSTIDRIEKEADGDFLFFYNHVCRESVSRMRQVLKDGML